MSQYGKIGFGLRGGSDDDEFWTNRTIKHFISFGIYRGGLVGIAGDST